MATATQSLTPYRITTRQFHQMIDAGVFPGDEKVELLRGLLIAMTSNEAHNFIVALLAERFRPLLPADYFLWQEKPVQLGRHWRPQPDLTILKGRLEDFKRRTPVAGDVALLIEVADTTYPKDAGLKLRRYAAVAIPAYWIVHVAAARVEVYAEPRGRGRMARYHKVVHHDAAGAVPVAVAGQVWGQVAVADFF